MSDDRVSLAAAVERLERITARLADPDAPRDELKGLAEDALAISAEITETLPRVIREIEAAAAGGGRAAAENEES